jgi:hypothetical protein
MRKSFRALVIGAFALAAISGGAVASAAGVSGPAFYVDGEVYRTVGTLTDFTGTGAPDHSFDTIYAFSQQLNVAEAAPGDRDYNGGRWRVVPVSFSDYDAAVVAHDANGSGNFDSEEEVLAAVAAGNATLGAVATSFECPVIPMPKGKNK